MQESRVSNASRNIIFGMFLKGYQILMPFLMRTAMMYYMGEEYLDIKAVNKAKKNLVKDVEVYDIADFFKIFSDSTRLQILFALNNNELSVNDLCAVLNMNKSAISHQLKYLRLNHLVKFTKKGKNVFYSHDDEHVSLIIETARRHLSEEE